jgi:hypothetical protein
MDDNVTMGYMYDGHLLIDQDCVSSLKYYIVLIPVYILVYDIYYLRLMCPFVCGAVATIAPNRILHMI